MKTGNKYTQLLTVFATVAIILSFSRQTIAVDDGARAYWKGRDGTYGLSFQYLRLDLQASGTKQFSPGQYIYANADTEASLMITNLAYHTTLLSRPSSLSLAIAGGDIDVDVNVRTPLQFIPKGIPAGTTFSQSSSGFADPSIQLDVNLFGTPPLKSGVDLLNYEPTWTLDVATMLAFPIGKYDDDKLVNMGLNRWFGRIALPFKYHFGPRTPGYMTSLEIIPSVWLFEDNDDFMGQELENDPMVQLEAHITHDFTPSLFGSIDVLYRGGFQSEIDDVEVGHDVDIGNVGFTFNYQVTDNLAIRTGYSTNLFGDHELDNSLFRVQFVYSWHKASENMKKLVSGH